MKPLVVALVTLCVALKVQIQSASGEEVLTGVIVDAKSGTKVDGVDVNLYELHLGGEEPSHVDSKKSDKDGIYRFDLKGTIRPIRLTCVKFSATGSQHLFGPVNIEPLEGGKGVVNIAITSSEGESLQSARARLRNLSDLLKYQRSQKTSVEIVPAAKLEDYVAGVVARLKDEHDIQFGNELASIVEEIRNNKRDDKSPSIGFAKGIVWQVKAGDTNRDGELTTWNLPDDLTKPVPVTSARKRYPLPFLKVNAGGSLPTKYNIAASKGSLCLLATKSLSGNEKTWALNVSIDPAIEDVAAKPMWFWGDVTSTAWQHVQPFTARGSSSGAITILAEDLSEVSVTPPVGSTPVAATAFSGDGEMIGGVCVDGSYKIWSVREGVLPSRKPIFEGKLPEPFPASMAFAPDGKSVVFGTGLITKHAGVVVLELSAATTRFTTTKADAAVTQIQFLNDSSDFICQDSKGATSVWNLKQSNVGLVASNEFQLLGIESLSVNPNGLTAFQVRGKHNPVVLSVENILKGEIFKNKEIGIERQEP